MNRETYLKELDRYLRKLPRDDYENAMEYFTEYFDEAGPDREEEVIRELGAPREAAAELLNELLTSSNLPVLNHKPEDDADDKKEAAGPAEKTESGKKAGERKPGFFERSSAGRIVLIALLAILAAPIGVPLGIFMIAMLFAGVVIAAAVFGSVMIAGIAAFFTGGWFICQSFPLFASSIGAGILTLGCGLLGIGLGLLVILFAIWAGRLMIFGLVRLISRLISTKGGKKHA